MGKIARFLIVLLAPSHVPDLIKLAETVFQMMTTNAALYPNPTPALSILAANTAALDKAETQVGQRIPGAIEARDQLVRLVRSNLEQERAYVQSLIDANPGQGAILAVNAGMSQRKARSYIKPSFYAKQGTASGIAVLFCLAAKITAAYEWQMSTDGKTWSNLPTTTVAKTTVMGLTPAATYYFRYRVVTKGPAPDWGQVISFLVK